MSVTMYDVFEIDFNDSEPFFFATRDLYLMKDILANAYPVGHKVFLTNGENEGFFGKVHSYGDKNVDGKQLDFVHMRFNIWEDE